MFTSTIDVEHALGPPAALPGEQHLIDTESGDLADPGLIRVLTGQAPQRVAQDVHRLCPSP